MEIINGSSKYEICTLIQKISEPCLYDFSGLMSNLFSLVSFKLLSFSIDTSLRFFFGCEEKRPGQESRRPRKHDHLRFCVEVTNQQRCVHERVVMVKKPWVVFPQFRSFFLNIFLTFSRSGLSKLFFFKTKSTKSRKFDWRYQGNRRRTYPRFRRTYQDYFQKWKRRWEWWINRKIIVKRGKIK